MMKAQKESREPLEIIQEEGNLRLRESKSTKIKHTTKNKSKDRKKYHCSYKQLILIRVPILSGYSYM